MHAQAQAHTSLTYPITCGLIFQFHIPTASLQIHRTFADAVTVLLVWAAETALYYASHGSHGQPWTRYSPLQLAGFALIVLGSVEVLVALVGVVTLVMLKYVFV